MPRKNLKVQVELDIQAVTCPGVWLCPSGKISLQICMLDSCIQTHGLLPNFPLLYHEKYEFYKIFYNAHSLADLHRLLHKAQLYAELIQWQNCDIGNVIASFQTSLCDVLYPSVYEGAIAGVDVDLLMEPSKNFPGIISPKIEISTRTTVEETVCTDSDQNCCKVSVINPITVTSELRGGHRNLQRQQKVCHSLGYHKRCVKTKKVSNKVPFAFKKAEQDLIGRKPEALERNPPLIGRCCTLPHKANKSPVRKCSKATEDFRQQYTKCKCSGPPREPHKKQMCPCSAGHGDEYCPVCVKYQYYFDSDACSCSLISKQQEKLNHAPHTSHVRKIGGSREIRKQRSSLIDLCKPPCVCGDDYVSPGSSSPRDRNFDVYRVGTQSKKPTLADQLHSRLKNTLDCRSYDNSASDTSPCPKFGSCKDGFYDNLNKFYRGLHG